MKNIYQRVNAVMKKVAYVKKDSTVSGAGGGYKAVTHDQVTAALRDAMAENGIVVVVKQTESKIIQPRDVEKGIKMHLYEAGYNIRFVNIDDKDDYIETVFYAHAADNGDKATGKAASYATKYAMLKTFGLETGEDDESRNSEPVLHSKIQKEEFDDILARKDALAMVVFSQTAGHDVMMSLNSAFESGEKSSGKKLVKELTSNGHAIIDETARQISELISANDPAVTEITDEMTPIEKRLVSVHLNKNELEYLRKLKEI